MWMDITVDDRDHPTSLCHYEDRLYWLIEDHDAQLAEDTFGRTVPSKKLISYDIQTAERDVLAEALPPSQTLTVGPNGAFVWGLLRESVLRITDEGDVEQFTRTEEQPDGGLECIGDRLFFVGKLNPATTGVAVYEPDNDHFRRVFETGDPTPSTLDRMHVGQDRVFYLTHDPRGWVLESVGLDGHEDEQLVTEQDQIFRRLTRTERGFVLGDDHALYLFEEGELIQFTETELPADEVRGFGEQAIWTTSAVENDVGQLVEPWRVYAAELQQGVSPEVIYESNDRIAATTSGPWGIACLLREAKVGVVAEIGTHPSGRVVIVSPR
jgi:hypothetical protein